MEIPVLHRIWELLVHNLSGKPVEPKTLKFGPQLMDYINKIEAVITIKSYF